MRTISRGCVSALMLAAAVSTAAAAGPGAAPLADHVPGDAVLFFEWAGAQNLKGAYAASNLKGFMDASTLPAFFSVTLPKMIGERSGSPEAVALAEAQGAAMLLPYWNHPAALYVGPADFGKGGEPVFHAALICEAGKDAGRLNAALQNIVQLAAANAPVKISLAANETLVVLAVGMDANTLLAANPKSLATNAAYLRTLAAQSEGGSTYPAIPAVTGYIDAHAFVANVLDGIQHSPDITPDDLKKITAVADAMGARSLNQVAFAAGFDGKQWSETSFLGVPASAPRVGLLRLLDPPAIDPAAIAAIPGNAITANVATLDLDGLFNDVRDLLPKIDPKAQATFDEGLKAMKQELGVDPHRDVIATLAGPVTVYQTDAAGLAYVGVVKLKDAAKFSAALATLVDKANASEPEGSQYKVEKEGESYKLHLPQVTVAWTVHGDSLYVSSDAGLTEALAFADAKGSKPSLADNADFQALRKAYPAKLTSLAYTQPLPLYGQLYAAAKLAMPLAARQMGVELPDDLLPAPEAVKGLLTPSMAVSWSGPDGIHSMARSAFPGAEILGSQGGSTVVAVAALGTAIMVPSVTRARGNAMKAASASNLHMLGIANNTYAAEYDGKMPDSMADFLTAQLVIDPKVFVEPNSGTTPLTAEAAKDFVNKDPADLPKALAAHSDYTYLGRGFKLTSVPRDFIVFYEKPLPGAAGINVGYGDAHVDFLTWPELANGFAATNAYLKAQGRDEVDVEALRGTSADGKH